LPVPKDAARRIGGGKGGNRIAFFNSRLSAQRGTAGYNRWLIPPAALCVHLCGGQAHAFSVFNLPMTRLIDIARSAPGDWKPTEHGWISAWRFSFLSFPPRRSIAG
jgi:hypothetical protein